MNGTDIFIDTNICIYLLNGDAVLAELLQDQHIFISIITEMELFAFSDNDALSTKILDSFIASVSVINIEDRVKANAIKIRRNTKLKLPDCIIAASALTYRIPFVTADKGLKKINNIDLILYQKV